MTTSLREASLLGVAIALSLIGAAMIGEATKEFVSCGIADMVAAVVIELVVKNGKVA